MPEHDRRAVRGVAQEAGRACTTGDNLERKDSAVIATKPPRPMTARQREVWEFIRDFRNVRGYCPSYEDVREHFG
ncbi:MAG: hypothetical protein FGM36_15900, partial [Burkholderiaceae bacterium]|nr:hypothetical protein [Burkholderiaceae bacterium]